MNPMNDIPKDDSQPLFSNASDSGDLMGNSDNSKGCDLLAKIKNCCSSCFFFCKEDPNRNSLKKLTTWQLYNYSSTYSSDNPQIVGSPRYDNPNNHPNDALINSCEGNPSLSAVTTPRIEHSSNFGEKGANFGEKKDIDTL